MGTISFLICFCTLYYLSAYAIIQNRQDYASHEKYQLLFIVFLTMIATAIIVKLFIKDDGAGQLVKIKGDYNKLTMDTATMSLNWLAKDNESGGLVMIDGQYNLAAINQLQANGPQQNKKDGEVGDSNPQIESTAAPPPYASDDC